MDWLIACVEADAKASEAVARRPGKPVPLSRERFVLEHGRPFQRTRYASGLPRRLTRISECFNNARLALLHAEDLFDDGEQYTYAEGFAASGRLVVHHGWLVDTAGIVVDPTWQRKQAVRPVYYGVSFRSDYVFERICSGASNSNLLDDYLLEGANPSSALVR